MKQFENRKELDMNVKKIADKVIEGLKAEEWFSADIDGAVAAALEAEGYNLDDLVADGDYYSIAGHTNNGRKWRKELSIHNLVSFEFEDEMHRFIRAHFIVDGVHIVAEGPSPEYFSFMLNEDSLEDFLNQAKVGRE